MGIRAASLNYKTNLSDKNIPSVLIPNVKVSSACDRLLRRVKSNASFLGYSVETCAPAVSSREKDR